MNELQANEILYVVDTRQSEHFELLFKTVAKWGIAKVDLRHVNFGTVMGKDRRPYKTRDGDTVGLESLLDEAVKEARTIVDLNEAQKADKGEEPLDDAARQAVAEIIGIGGIKYADLHHSRESDYVFDWEKMLAKEGDTATYIQYAFARPRGSFARTISTLQRCSRAEPRSSSATPPNARSRSNCSSSPRLWTRSVPTIARTS